MATDHIRYDLLVQDAFRGIFRKVLTDAASHGLPGEHHFYITFKTGAPGVVMSDRLRAEYPEQMTIILQHQFWDLRVHDSGFEVGLSFRRVPEKLEIPFSAVSGFFDPSVNFGAEFTAEEEGETGQPKKTESTLVSLSGTQISNSAATLESVKAGAPKPQTSPSAEKADTPARPHDRSEPATEAPAAEPAGDETHKVVSIDAFRKKNT